jgi:hypothetical protein
MKMKTTGDIICDALDHCCKYYNFEKAHTYDSKYFLKYNSNILDYKRLYGYTQDSYNQFLRILKHFIRVKHDAKNILYLPKYINPKNYMYVLASVNINFVVYTDIFITKEFIEDYYENHLDFKTHKISDIIYSLINEGLDLTRLSDELLDEYLSDKKILTT